MSVADLIHRAEVAGLELVPEGETFRIYGTGPKPMELLRELKAHSRSKTPVAKISKLTKRTKGALRQKALHMGLPLGHRR